MEKKPTLYIAATYEYNSILYKDALIKDLPADTADKFRICDCGANKNYGQDYNVKEFTPTKIAQHLYKYVKPQDKAIVISGNGDVIADLNMQYKLVAIAPISALQTKSNCESVKANVLVLSSEFIKRPNPIVQAFLTTEFIETKAALKRFNTLTNPKFGRPVVRKSKTK